MDSRLAIVTVLFNSDGVLEGFFQSLSKQSYKDYHVFFIDNQQFDHTEALVRSLANKYPIPGYTYIQNKNNVGVATGNNQGIKLSLEGNFTHTLLANNDIEFHQDYLLGKMAERAVTANESLIIPKIYYYDTRKIWMAGGYFRRNRGIVGHVADGEDNSPSNSKEAYFEYAPTCFMLIGNDVFKRIGIMDEKYFVYYDDVDFLYRALNAGYRILLMPDLSVLHKVSSSTGGSESTFSIYYNTRNRIYFLRKNFGIGRFLIALTFTIASRLVRAIGYNKKQNEQLFKAMGDGFRL